MDTPNPTPTTPTDTDPTPESRPAQAKLRDRAWGWRTVAATGLAGLLLGGAGGAVITQLVTDNEPERPTGRFAPPGGFDGERPDFREGERPDFGDGEPPQPPQEDGAQTPGAETEPDANQT